MNSKIKKHYLKFLVFILMISCDNKKQDFERLEAWEAIQIAVKEKRIDYLLEISKDTLECLGCNNGEDWIDKKGFFPDYLDQIKESYDKEYSIYSEKYTEEEGFTERHRINYAYKGEKKYNLIYTILTGKKEVQIQGVFSVP